MASLGMTATSYRSCERRVVREVTTSGTETFQYYTIGRFMRRTDRLGRITELSYNGRDQVATERWLDASGTVSRTINFAYNSWGELLTVGDASHTYSYLYDQLGRITDAIYAINGFTLVNGVTPSVKLSHTNNLASERTLVKTYLGAAPDYYENIYDLDALGRWKSVTQRDDTNIISNPNPDAVIDKHVVFSYGAPGNVNSISRYARTPTADVGIASTSITYTNNGQLDIITHTLTANGNVINGYDLQYDTANRLDAVAAIPGSPFATETVDFAYDLAGQLTQANDNDGNLTDNELYSYDSNGNRDKQNPNGPGTPIYGNHNRLMTDEVFDYTYDAEGNLKSRTTRVGLNNRAKWEYDWDHRNRMTEARLYDLQNGAALSKTVRYDYDAMNQLIRKQVFTGPNQAFSNQAFFVYDGGQVALQFDGPALQNVSHHYLWGPAVDQLLAVDDVSHGTSAERKVHWALSDHLGTIRDIVTHNATSPATTSSTHRTYDAFGNVLSTAGSAAMTDVVFGFTGRMFDSDSGLQNNLHRWYDPHAGRWISEDPIGFAAGDANLYRYVGNRVTEQTDPSGLLTANQLAVTLGGRWLFRALTPVLTVNRWFQELSPIDEWIWGTESYIPGAREVIFSMRPVQNKMNEVHSQLSQKFRAGTLDDADLSGAKLVMLDNPPSLLGTVLGTSTLKYNATIVASPTGCDISYQWTFFDLIDANTYNELKKKGYFLPDTRLYIKIFGYYEAGLAFVQDGLLAADFPFELQSEDMRRIE